MLHVLRDEVQPLAYVPLSRSSDVFAPVVRIPAALTLALALALTLTLTLSLTRCARSPLVRADWLRGTP